MTNHFIKRETLEQPGGRICVVTFDRPDSAANILDRATLEELEKHLAEIEADSTIKGVVFTSAEAAIFIAGADLRVLDKGRSDRAVVQAYLELGQDVLSHLAQLKMPTVAAIHGACVGGGCELALACDYRIATPDKPTKIGLPETQLGILPAWGGSTRLPRLIGIPRALDIILGGKTPPARKALKLGLIDELAPREWLLRAALKALAEGRVRKTQARERAFQGPLNRAMALTVGGKVRADVMRRTRGHYPAVLKALDVILQGAGERELGASLAREREAVVELAAKEACGNLMHVYLLQERARKLARQAALPDFDASVHCAAVIGAGVMGAGITQWLSARGMRVILRDIDAGRVGAGMARVFKLYDDAVKHRILTPREARDGIDRIAPAATEVPLGHVQLVIEAAVEKLSVKAQIFQKLDTLVPPGAVLASNTSALPVSQLAQATALPGRVLGLHFFNPVHRMQLVEVVLPPDVAPEAKARALAFVQQIGKLPVVVRDTPGFLVNRILLPYLVEAANAFNAGVSVLTIDEAMLDFGMPMGPLRLVDEVGVDIAKDVAQTLATAFPERMSVPPLLAEMVEAGLLGRKSGNGFYLHAGQKSKEPQVNGRMEAFRAGKFDAALVPDPRAVQTRMVCRMLDEAARCLDEGVVEHPEDVDFGMIMGAGFPPFRGGPLRYADTLGAARIVEEMEAQKLKPCDRLYAMAEKNRKFYED